MSSQQIEADEKIIDKITNGDVDAYAEIMARYEQKLLRYVIYLIHNNDVAADVVQDTFIKTYQNLNSFNPKYKFSSWIYRIAHNEAINTVRKDRHINHDVDTDEMGEESYEMNIIKEIDRSILNSDMQICLNKLDLKYREVLMLQYYENMKYEDIADVLHMPISTVGVRASRAKVKLRKLCQQKGARYE